MSLQSVDLIHFFHKQIDNARTHPNSVIQQLKDRQFINETQFVHSQVRNIRYQTEEGQEAVNEAIEYLENKQPTQKLILSGSLCEAAFQVGNRNSSEAMIEDPSIYQSQVEKEIQKTGADQFGEIGIIVQYGFRMDPQVVPTIIVDDGDPRRSRRSWLMHEKTKYIGLSVHEHSQFDYMVFIILTDRLVETGSSCSCRLF